VFFHEKPRMKIGYTSHVHSEAELLIYIGTNPDDPDDLEAELERHIITRTAGIFIEERFYIIEIEPVIAPFADTI
jgi:hypothetical protein